MIKDILKIMFIFSLAFSFQNVKAEDGATNSLKEKHKCAMTGIH